MPNWYAIYTRSRYEKKVFSELTSKGVEAYLPLIKNLKQWSDRKKWVEEPLIRSYVFVYVDRPDYNFALQVTGAVKYVFFEGKPAIIPAWQIMALKTALEIGKDFVISGEALAAGDRVLITRGPFSNIHGELVEIQGSRKVVIRIDHIGYSLLLTIAPGHLRKV
ncbi:MAG: UpxY family transcription antiterminator [Bacteroidales bacterium]|nr:UpxY family transcription antiterminator [Bacteroidales bacterium]MDZ4204333.1 UpxY family transcription antiterminator [Bacteroidales bacterium]